MTRKYDKIILNNLARNFENWVVSFENFVTENCMKINRHVLEKAVWQSRSGLKTGRISLLACLDEVKTISAPSHMSRASTALHFKPTRHLHTSSVKVFTALVKPPSHLAGMKENQPELQFSKFETHSDVILIFFLKLGMPFEYYECTTNPHRMILAHSECISSRMQLESSWKTVGIFRMLL